MLVWKSGLRFWIWALKVPLLHLYLYLTILCVCICIWRHFSLYVGICSGMLNPVYVLLNESTNNWTKSKCPFQSLICPHSIWCDCTNTNTSKINTNTSQTKFKYNSNNTGHTNTIPFPNKYSRVTAIIYDKPLYFLVPLLSCIWRSLSGTNPIRQSVPD